MVKAVPPVLKPITPYVQRADELHKVSSETSRAMAFFCGKYAMELGMTLSDKSPEAKAFLLELMKELETGKVKMDDAAARLVLFFPPPHCLLPPSCVAMSSFPRGQKTNYKSKHAADLQVVFLVQSPHFISFL